MAGVNQNIGTHEVVVRKVKVYKEDGAVKVAAYLEFENGEVGTKYLGTKTPKSFGIMRKSLKAMGFDVDKLDIQELVNNEALLDGKKCEVTVEENEYNGKISNQIAWINALRQCPEANDMAELTKKLREVKKADEEESL